MTVVALSMVLAVLTATRASALSMYKVIANPRAREDRFGWTVSLSGHRLAIGAHGVNNSAGAVYIFRDAGTLLGWIQYATITASDSSAMAFFGNSVSLDGDVLAVGSFTRGIGGAVYVFRHDGFAWEQEAKLTASDAGLGDAFGWSLAIDGNVLVVGAPDDDDVGRQSGSVYVFRYDGSSWIEEDKVTASDGAEDDGFGISVSVDGDRFVAGAYSDNDAGSNSGSAYVFRYGGGNWIEAEDKLVASDAAAWDEFGRCVAISGDRVIVGAHKHDGDDSNSGAAYVFARDGSNWLQEAKLTAPDPEEGDFFGWGVAMDGDMLAAGAYGKNNVAGSAYVFKYDGTNWLQKAYVAASDGEANDQLGWGISIDGDNVAAGALGADNYAGSAYLFLNIEGGSSGGGCFLSTVPWQ